MKLNSFWCLLALFVSSFGLNAQTEIPVYEGAQLKHGEYIKLNRKTLIGASQVLSLNDNFYYSCPIIKFKFGIPVSVSSSMLKIDKELNIKTPTKRPQLQRFEVNGEKAMNNGIMVFGKKICAFNALYSRKADTKTLYLQEIDPENLIPSRSAKQVAQITEAKNLGNSGKFNFVVSSDSSKLLICADMPRRRKDNAAYGFTVMNDKFDILWSKNVEMPYEENLFEMQDFKVDNEGNVYIVAKLYKERRREKSKGNPNYSYIILKYSQNGEQTSSKVLELDNKYVSRLGLYAGDKNNIRCVGFYSLNVNSADKGIFYLSLDANLSVTKEAYKDLSVEDISSADGQDKRSFGRSISDISLGNFIFRAVVGAADGGIQMVAEEHWITSVTTTDSRGRMQTRHYSNFGALVVIDLSPTGDINWVSFIKKYEQVGGFDYSPRFFLVPTEQGLRFFINDHPSNYDPDRRKARGVSILSYKRKGLVSGILLDHQGKQTRQALPIDKKYKGFLLPYAAYWDGNKEVVFPIYRARKLRLDRLQLP